MAVADILAKIVERKREEIAALEALRPRGFAAALRARAAAGRPAVIAEIKKASPSRGVLSTDFDPVRIARSYERYGAAALSVLTDRDFFQGSLGDMQAARAAVGLPVIRKDFTLSERQILEAAAAGADAVLLIVAILGDRELRDLREYAEGLGLDALVEVHDREELKRAVGSGAKVIGVNNRDLRTFAVKLETSLELAAGMPEGVLRVSESGIFTRADVERLRGAGYEAFLVGESLMRQPETLEELAR
jgi:indole-3-glycerol phosphate synthase